MKRGNGVASPGESITQTITEHVQHDNTASAEPSPNMLKTGAPARSREALATSYQMQRMSLFLPSAILHGTRNPFTSETKKDRPWEGVLGNRPSRLECARPTPSLRWPTLRGGEDEASPTDQRSCKFQLGNQKHNVTLAANWPSIRQTCLLLIPFIRHPKPGSMSQ